VKEVYRQHLQSASYPMQLFVPRHWRSTFGRRAFSVAGLPWRGTHYHDTLRDPTRSQCERVGSRKKRDVKSRRKLSCELHMTVSGVIWQLFFSQFTSIYSALKVVRLCTILMCGVQVVRTLGHT